jgi:hypothetical protein
MSWGWLLPERHVRMSVGGAGAAWQRLKKPASAVWRPCDTATVQEQISPINGSEH